MIQHNGKLVLGVDMGNYNMKTAHNCFPSAYMELAGDGNNYRSEEHTSELQSPWN